MMPAEAKKKKRRLDCPVAATPAAGIKDLSTDELANIFGFPTPEEIMRARIVNKKMRDAAQTTIVPMSNFCVASVRKFGYWVAIAQRIIYCS